ncbi:hypothetical protein C1645_839462 [Glomus cerebriforme]|uniref:Uncharacterized protein n=1 Tax=Glomus cerebriforme TaxID=658196 RepID=A0A397SCA4_9GLOM|nr:hypothetical protein C1645_839462 [Glomus cerebriforme]
MSQQSDLLFLNIQTKIGQIKLSNLTSVLRKEMPDNYSKNKSTDDNNEEEPSENEMMFNDTSFITYD